MGRLCEIRKSFLEWVNDLNRQSSGRAYLDGLRISSLHQHHGHRWSKQDNVRVFV
jgi:hypothetical protein